MIATQENDEGKGPMTELRRELMPRVLVLTCITSALIVATNVVHPGTF